MSELYRPVRIGSLELKGNLFLAPMAGYTDRVYRSICAEMGADFSFTELSSAEGVVRGGAYTYNLIRRGDNEKNYAIQLFGHDSETMYKAALALAPLQPEAVDINSGCPVPKVVKLGAGSALMKDPALLGRIVETVKKASNEALGGVPVTVKIRSGWDSASINYNECARIAEEAGASMITLHPRTRAQAYGGKSNWLHIKDLVTRIKIPVCASGDLYSPMDAERVLKETGAAALMFARGAVGNPFIFPASRAYLTGGKWEMPVFSERIKTALRHLELLTRDIGEERASKEMRKQFAAYVKGEPGSAALRNNLVRAKSIAEYKEILGVVD